MAKKYQRDMDEMKSVLMSQADELEKQERTITEMKEVKESRGWTPSRRKDIPHTFGAESPLKEGEYDQDSLQDAIFWGNQEENGPSAHEKSRYRDAGSRAWKKCESQADLVGAGYPPGLANLPPPPPQRQMDRPELNRSARQPPPLTRNPPDTPAIRQPPETERGVIKIVSCGQWT